MGARARISLFTTRTAACVPRWGLFVLASWTQVEQWLDRVVGRQSHIALQKRSYCIVIATLITIVARRITLNVFVYACVCVCVGVMPVLLA
jgi:hypothetical protein